MRWMLPLSVALLACACTQTTAPPADPSGAAPTASTPKPTSRPAPQPTTPVTPEAPAPGRTTDTVPTRYHGRWAADAAACAADTHESRLVIGASQVTFYEGSGAVKSASEDGNTVSVVMTQTSEGNTFEATRRYTLSGDGNTLSDGDSGMARMRCG